MNAPRKSRRFVVAWARAGVALALLCGAPEVAFADRWESTRAEVIDPLNSELHRHLPTYLRDRDLGAILDLYEIDVGEGIAWSGARTEKPDVEEKTTVWLEEAKPESIRDRYERLLALFPTVDKAEVRIHLVHWRDADEDGIPAEIRWVVRGVQADGSRGQLDQRADLRIARRDGDWKILAERVTERVLVTREEPRFVAATATAGIDDEHRSEGSPVFRIIGDLVSFSGSAVADVDRDGCEDLFLAGAPRSTLHRSRCDGTFEDATEALGLPRPYPAIATGALFFDYDDDGWQDLYVTATRGGDRLFRNREGRFVDVTEEAGIPGGEWGSMVIAADVDRDGDLDVFVTRMGDHEKRSPVPNYEATNGLPDTLLRNEGDGTFTDVSEEAGVADPGWGLAAAFGDYDDDGDPDLFVSNEFGFSSLYRNRGDGTFEEIGAEAGARLRTAGMGAAWGDADGDGRLDLYVSAMYANSRWALFHPDFPVPIPWWASLLRPFTDEVDRRSAEILDELTRGSTLLRNAGDGTFEDVSDEAGVRDAQWGWAADFLDYDNDGDLDLYAVNGFLTGPIPDDV